MSRATARTFHLDILRFDDVECTIVGLDPAINQVPRVWANEFEACHCHPQDPVSQRQYFVY